ncbi:MAG: hypothetical protein R3C02_13530 [Planctomycetaceae bacterium]
MTKRFQAHFLSSPLSKQERPYMANEIHRETRGFTPIELLVVIATRRS